MTPILSTCATSDLSGAQTAILVSSQGRRAPAARPQARATQAAAPRQGDDL